MSLAGFSRNGSSPFLTFRQTCLVFGHLPNSYPQLGTRSSQIKGSVRAQQVTAGGIRHDKLDKRSPREGQEHFVSNLSLHLEAVRMGGKCSGTMGSPRKSPEFSTAQRLEMTTYLTENALTGCWHPWEKGFFFFLNSAILMVGLYPQRFRLNRTGMWPRHPHQNRSTNRSLPQTLISGSQAERHC